MSDAPTRDYLERYAEKEARHSYQLNEQFEHVVVVPAYDEDPTLLLGLEGACRQPKQKVLLILVVNCAEGAPALTAARTEALVAQLRKEATSESLQSTDPPIYLLKVRSLNILLVDRASAGFRLGQKQGVGLARRIGCDLALALASEGFIRSPWIASTDADVALPADYFDTLSAQPPTASAILFPFTHTPNNGDSGAISSQTPEAISEATLLFECSLRYLVLGLHYARSPYAFHTIGSTLAVSRTAYAQARGFPKLLAGEDFHLLNKLAKVGPIRRVAGTPISITSRISERTPFGTGKSVLALLNATREIPTGLRQPRAFYHPEVFVALRLWHDTLRNLALHPDTFEWERPESNGLSPPLQETLLTHLNDATLRSKLLRSLHQRKTPEQRLEHVFAQFDALSGVQLVRRMNEACPPLRWQEALLLAPFIEQSVRPHSPAGWAKLLRAQEAQLPPEIGPTCFRQMS